MNEHESTFRFKQFGLTDRRCGMKIGTDGVLLGAWATSGAADGHLLDTGAGCGLIALMLAQRYPMARITGVELDAGACADFAENAARSPFGDRIEVLRDDFANVGGQYDLIVSNPPFFADSGCAMSAARASARNMGALSPMTLPAFAAGHLTPRGHLAMIMPVELYEAVDLECTLHRLYCVRTARFASSARRGVTRIMVEYAVQRPPQPPVHETITKGDARYAALTHEFYL